jgi:hypothetical protein
MRERMSSTRKPLSIWVSSEALARLDARVAEGKRAGFPVQRAALAAALLHGALGLDTDGAPRPVARRPDLDAFLDALAPPRCTRGPHVCQAVCPDAFGVPCSPPAEERSAGPARPAPPLAPADVPEEHPAERPSARPPAPRHEEPPDSAAEDEPEESRESERARALDYAREAYGHRVATLANGPGSRAVVDAWIDDLDARFSSFGLEVVRGILAEIGVMQELLAEPADVRAQALAAARELCAVTSFPGRSDAERWIAAIAARFPGLGSTTEARENTAAGILAEIGVPRELLEPSPAEEHDAARPSPADVVATIRATLRRKSPGERERQIAAWVAQVMEQSGCTEDAARQALEVERRRFYAHTGEMLTAGVAAAAPAKGKGRKR